DGWWAEAYEPGMGWALGDGQEHGDDPAWDAAEAEDLYRVLEEQIVPEFYARGADGVPAKWVERMRRSMSTLTPRFSANRTVREYTERYYLAAAARYQERARDRGAWGVGLVDWQRTLAQHWRQMRFGETRVERVENGLRFAVHVQLGMIPPDAVRV